MSTAPAVRPASAPDAKQGFHAALSTERPPRPSAVSTAITFGWRGMLKIKHVPEQLLDVTVTPVLFLLMFTYLFGGALEGSTDAYLQYLLPGMLVQTILFVAVYAGVSLNTDVTKGVTDRFRSLPIWRPAPLAGAVLGDCVRYALAGTIVLILGIVLGYDPGNIVGIVGALALVILFAVSLSWIFTTLGLIMRTPNAVLNTGFMALFPLIFLSNIFVDPETLPRGLEAFVSVNPVSHLATAARGLMGGDADAGDVLLAAGEAVAIAAIFAPLTVRLYRRA